MALLDAAGTYCVYSFMALPDAAGTHCVYNFMALPDAAGTLIVCITSWPCPMQLGLSLCNSLGASLRSFGITLWLCPMQLGVS